MSEDPTQAALARRLAELQGVALTDADAALCARLLDAIPASLEAPLEAARGTRADQTLFDVPPGAHAAVLRGERA